MVKGVLRKTVVVNPPEKGIFDQVIFVLKDSATQERALTQEQVLEMANRHLEAFLDYENLTGRGKKKKRALGAACAAAGAVVTAAVWAVSGFLA